MACIHQSKFRNMFAKILSKHSINNAMNDLRFARSIVEGKESFMAHHLLRRVVAMFSIEYEQFGM